MEVVGVRRLWKCQREAKEAKGKGIRGKEKLMRGEVTAVEEGDTIEEVVAVVLGVAAMEREGSYLRLAGIPQSRDIATNAYGEVGSTKGHHHREYFPILLAIMFS